MVGVAGPILRAGICLIMFSLLACSGAPPESAKPAESPVPAIERLAAEASVDLGLSASLPAYRDPIVQEWSLYNSRCRGGAVDETACQKRDALSSKVEARGWCYERGPQGGTDWISCNESGRYEDADLLAEGPQPRGSVSGDEWYLVGVRTGECALVSAILGVSTPEDVAALYASQGRPLQIANRTEVSARLREAGNDEDPGMALVRGRTNCDFALARLNRGQSENQSASSELGPNGWDSSMARQGR
jgi:hypothetical protein